MVSIRPSDDGKLAVTFDEHDVGATAKQWEAAAWNAAVTASLITGAPLAGRELHFAVNGRPQGQSVGALLTVAVIALMRGDKLEPDITATGTVNPDGSIGPVTGVPESVAAAVRAHRARACSSRSASAARPMRRARSSTSWRSRRGSDCASVEAGDVYEAYQLFTGKVLPQPPASTKTTLNRDVYERLAAKVDTWTARFVAARAAFRSLAPSVQQDLNPYAAAAQRQQQQARKLTDAGEDAGAFSATVNATALMRAVAQVGAALPTLLGQGVPPFVDAITKGDPVEAAVGKEAEELADASAEHLTDASARIAAYGNVLDAASLARFGRHLFDAKDATGQPDLSRVVEGAIYYGLAGSLVAAAHDLVAVGSDLGGAPVASNVDPGAAADALRAAAHANLGAFHAAVIAPRAFASRTNVAAASDAIAQADTVFALARTGEQTLASLPEVLGDRSPPDDAALGGAISVYVRSAVLGAKYTSLGEVDPATLQLAARREPGGAHFRARARGGPAGREPRGVARAAREPDDRGCGLRDRRPRSGRRRQRQVRRARRLLGRLREQPRARVARRLRSAPLVGEQLAWVPAVDVADERRVHVVPEQLLQARRQVARDVGWNDEHVVLDRPQP